MNQEMSEGYHKSRTKLYSALSGVGVDKCVLEGLGLERKVGICHVGRVLRVFQVERTAPATKRMDPRSGGWSGRSLFLFYMLSVLLSSSSASSSFFF